jgi:uncharacterized protein Yka (UPF0111/DUF47 family)
MYQKGMSNAKRNRCQYIFARGPNKGEKCLQCCKDEFCKHHAKLAGQESPEKNNSPVKTVEQMTKLLNQGKIDRKQLNDIKMKLRQMEDDCSRMARLYHGYAMRIDPEHKVPIRKKIIQDMQSKEFKLNCMSEYEELDKDTQKKYGYFEGYFAAAKERYLSYPNTYINVIQFNGTVVEATKKMRETEQNYKAKIEKIMKLRACIKEAEARLESEDTE